jgi:hypothetical protein
VDGHESGLAYEQNALDSSDFHQLTKNYLSRKLKKMDWQAQARQSFFFTASCGKYLALG